MEIGMAYQAGLAQKEARKVLKKLRIRTAPIPVEAIAEMLGARISYMPFEGELAGMLIRSNDDTIIGINSLHHPNRQRFTIAHECGHLILHDGEEIHIDRSFRVNRRDARSSKAIDRHEIEANQFAAELLMPFELMKNDLDLGFDAENETELKELAKKYQVSVQAITHRISGIIGVF